MAENDATLMNKGLECLEQAVPSGFEEMLGCETSTNYLGIFWDDDDAELVYDDGFLEDTLDIDIWELWSTSSGVNAKLEDLRCPIQSGADCALLLDLETCQLYMGNRELVRQIVGEHFSTGRRHNNGGHGKGRRLQTNTQVGDHDTQRWRQEQEP
jgi:hypothetical protein